MATMISGHAFVDLARRRAHELAERYGMSELDSRIERTFAELWFSGPQSRLILGMDRAQDYRVYARIGISGLVNARTSARDDDGEFDLQFILQQAGQPWDGFGGYAIGDRAEIDATLAQLIAAVDRYAGGLLSGERREWQRMNRVIERRRLGGA